MIRRGFWLTAGAVTGIYGYRRVSAVGRRLSGTLNRSGPGPRRAHRGAVALTFQTYRFTRDVREGMELYLARHGAPAGSTLSTDRALSTGRSLSTNHDAQPEDGH
jgi:hypothetical protein